MKALSRLTGFILITLYFPIAMIELGVLSWTVYFVMWIITGKYPRYDIAHNGWAPPIAFAILDKSTELMDV